MKTSSTLFLLLSATLLSLTACFSPRPVVRIEPADPPDKWNYGQAILEAEQDDVIASASYAFSDRDYHVFDLEVTNWRPDRILVDPAGIEFVLPGGERRLSAIDPEDQLFNMEVDASRREASAKNAAVVAGVVAVAAVTAAVISDSNGGGSDANNVVDDNAVGDVVNIAPTLFIGAGGGGAPRQPPIEVDPWFWSDQTLRKTTLENGQKVRGKVLFPRDDKVRDFHLLVPVEELIFTFAFKQRLFQP